MLHNSYSRPLFDKSHSMDLSLEGYERKNYVYSGFEASDSATKDEWLHFLQELKLFQGWPVEMLRQLLSHMRLKKFSSKQIVLTRTRESSKVLIVKSGTVLVWTYVKRISEQDNTTNNKNVNRSRLNLFEDKSKIFKSLQKVKTEIDFHSQSFYTYPINNKTKENTRSHESNLNTIINLNSQNDFGNSTTRLENQASFRLKSRTNRKNVSPTAKQRRSMDWDNFFQKQCTFFLEISRLRKGDVFGLDSDFLEKYPNCQLISDDCECLFIDKEILLNSIPRKVHSSFNMHEDELFPTVDEISKKFKEYLNWKFYSKNLIEETANIKMKSRKSFLR